MKKKNEREKERNKIGCVNKLYEQNGKENCKFIVRGGKIRKVKK